jgi:metal-dependent amidase/aminoacylase/carboxypeptidase family protein
MRNFRISIVVLLLAAIAPAAFAEADDWHAYIDAETERLYDQVVEWRRHFHQNPELSNREFETAAYIEAFLRGLDMEITTNVAHTGVVAVLRGGRPGPVVGLRADMDALPVPSRVGLPFSPDVTGEFLGEEVPVSHACGHDAHMAMLMGVAEMMAARRDELPGTIKFIFQPAEEGAPPGEEGGAELMVKENVLSDPDVDVVFGQHIWSPAPAGMIGYRPGGMLAASDRFVITINGKQTHGSTPWTGIDPIAVAAQMIMGLNTIVSRQTELTREAAVISVGRIRSGVRNNIIPETAELIALSAGATAEIDIQRGYPVTYNDPDLTEAMRPTLERIGGPNTRVMNAITGAEDFSFFAREVPGLYLAIGGAPAGLEPGEVRRS